MSSTYRVGYPPVHADWKNQIDSSIQSTPRDILKTINSFDADDTRYKTELYE